MKNRIIGYGFYFLIVINVMLQFTSCDDCIDGQGMTIVEDREIESYEELEVNIASSVKIVPGDDLFVRVEAQENLVPVIKTIVKGNTLIIKSNRCINSVEPVQIQLTVPVLNSVSINGSADVFVDGSLRPEDFEININGSGDFRGDIFTNSLDAGINGSGSIIINGTADDLEIEINGSGDFRGFGLRSYQADATIRGSGNADVNALNELKAAIMGSGNVNYTGNPKISTSINGSGEVSKKN